MQPESEVSIATQKWHRLWRLVATMPRAVRLKLKGDQVGLYSLICNEFLELGGVYVKFLQGVLLQSDVVKSWQGENKHKIFESVPAVPIDIDLVLAKELGLAGKMAIAHYERQPFATGSFGQVYRARLAEGDEVIIKILRPHIRSILKFDLRILSFVAKIFTTDFTSIDVSMKRAVRDFRAMTLREVDYQAEAAFAEEMHEVFSEDEYIVIPKTYRSLCSPQVIVQEYIPGVSVAHILQQFQQTGENPEAITARLVGSDLKWQLTHLATEVLYRFFTQQRMPGDLHPGNIRLLPQNRVGIVDFGISARRPRTPNVFYTLLKQLTHVEQNGETAGQMFTTYIKYFSYDLWLAFERISRQVGGEVRLADVVSQYAQQLFHRATGGAFSVSEIGHDTMFGAHVNKVVNEGNRFCIVTQISEVELLRAVQTLVATIDSLEQRELIGIIFRAVYDRVTNNLPQFTKEPPNPLTIHRATAIIDAWLARLALKNPELFLQVRSYLQANRQVISGPEVA